MFKHAPKFIFHLTVAVILFSGCDRHSNTSLQPGNKEIPDQEGWNSVVKITTRGRPSAIIHYGHMQKYSKKNLLKFDSGIEIDFYNTQGQHTSNLIADEGRMYENTGNVEALKRVTVVSDSGITLRTEHLLWDTQKEKIISDKFVTITTPAADTLYGKGFESDQTLQNWIIKNPTGIANKKVNFSDFEKGNAPLPDTTKVDRDPAREEVSGENSGDTTKVQRKNDMPDNRRLLP